MITGTGQIRAPLTGAPPTYEEAMGLFTDIPPPPFEISILEERLPGVVTNQPGQETDEDIKWMPLPRIDPNSSCPYGLEYLLKLNGVRVKRERWRMFENRRYGVVNNIGEKIYVAADNGSFLYTVQDQLERHTFTIKRESYCLCYGITSECVVECPPGETTSFIIGSTGLCMSNIEITDKDKTGVLNIDAPLGCSFCEDEKLPVLAKKLPVAQIRRSYPDIPLSERFDYIITFPCELDVRMKAALIATAIKIDVDISEQRTRNNN
ncbi:hypothetical protein PMAYCL1PPCAC_21052 [Pristionchus mayeri]|uniref:Phospholipid scramblase n=1 Tax=Pristionchus mayeri TaxID=1317129 RepID=A0AAN5CVM2_9BILA|nr:hypothetical protein PMAYCL1PPCAC_21052 [Pristionchus mayeri]